MRRRAAAMLILFLCIRLLPGFAISWAERLSLPMLRILEAVGDRFSFVLLETAAGLAAMLFISGLLCGRGRSVLMRILSMLLAGWLLIWYPLYFLPSPDCRADTLQISALCGELIDRLNGAENSSMPAQDLPAKQVRFPGWMDALGIDGLCAFMTGEALVAPGIHASSLPFVAVHERMHLRGFAGEGAANIAAWEECISRGGAYTDSARLWALRYGMGILRRSAPEAYHENMHRMDHDLLQRYQEAGGAFSPAPLPVFMERLYTALGIFSPINDYEILAPCLAARMAQ